MGLPVSVVFDANILFSAPLRDIFIRFSLAGFFQMRWTEAIHEEWMRNLVENYPAISREKAEKIKLLMNQTLRDSLVTGYENLIETLKLPDPDDRHVLAAAIHCNAEAIVTFNLKDFPTNILAPYGITVLHPDEFVVTLFDAAPESVCQVIKHQRESLKKPTKTVDEMLAIFEKQGLAQTVVRLKEVLNLL